MLAVGLFVAFWVVVALGVFLLAGRGRFAGLQARTRRSARRADRLAMLSFVLVAIVFGIGLPAVFLIGNHENASAQVGGYELTAGEKAGREQFGAHCAVCHTLAAANAIGKVGPNLDQLKPSASLVLHTIEYGCLPNAPSGSQEICLGQGVMPSGVVEGLAAQEVADFVARAAGNGQ